MINPNTHCVQCGHCYRFSDETCTECGFNPCDGGPDEDRQEKAELAWEERDDDQ